MAASATKTNQANILNRIFGPKLAEPLLKASRLVNKIKKDTNFRGADRTVQVKVAPTAGGSSDFAVALATQNASVPVRFVVTRRKEYQVFSIDGETIQATKGDRNAQIEVLKSETKSARYAYARAVAAKAHGNGGGSLGRIDATTTLSGTTLILQDTADHVHFEKNMSIGFSDDDGTAASPAGLHGSPTYLTVSAVDRENGQITTSAAIDTVTGVGTTDYIFRQGDYGNAMTGLNGWCPITAPVAAESFFGVDRTDDDVQRVAGFRYDDNAGGQMVETIINGAAEADMAGIDCDIMLISSRRMAALVNELGGDRVRNGVSDSGIGYKFVEISAPVGDGTIQVMADKDVIDGYGWGIKAEEMYLRTAGEAPDMLNHAGGTALLPAYDADAVQGRLGSYGNFFHENPGNSLIITF